MGLEVVERSGLRHQGSQGCAAPDSCPRSRTPSFVELTKHRADDHTNRIFVFDQGRVAEAGPFNDLIKQGGIFAELAMSSSRSQ